jgi:nucleotide-binding universal stress UspA family protein
MSAPVSRLPSEGFGAGANRLLLPIDLAKCPPEIFPLAKGFARPHGGEIELLYVLDLQSNAGQRGASEADRNRAERHLERIGRYFLWPAVKACFRVRAGIPHEEIFAEATAARADLILLPVHTLSIWRRLVGSGHGETSRRLVAGASCGVFVVDVRMCFNCFRHWAD